MTEPIESYEYSLAYWITAHRHMPASSVVFGAITTERDGTVITKTERQWQLVFENQLGRDGWLMWSRWTSMSTVQWLIDQLKKEFPEINDIADGNILVADCRLRRTVRPTT